MIGGFCCFLSPPLITMAPDRTIGLPPMLPGFVQTRSRNFIRVGASMSGVWVVLATSGLLGLVTGLMFRVKAMALVSLVVAVGSAITLKYYDFGFTGGVLTIVACLFVSQAAYFVATIFAPRPVEAEFLVNDAVDDPPDSDRKRNIGDK